MKIPLARHFLFEIVYLVDENLFGHLDSLTSACTSDLANCALLAINASIFSPVGHGDDQTSCTRPWPRAGPGTMDISPKMFPASMMSRCDMPPVAYFYKYHFTLFKQMKSSPAPP